MSVNTTLYVLVGIKLTAEQVQFMNAHWEAVDEADGQPLNFPDDHPVMVADRILQRAKEKGLEFVFHGYDPEKYSYLGRVLEKSPDDPKWDPIIMTISLDAVQLIQHTTEVEQALIEVIGVPEDTKRSESVRLHIFTNET